MKLKIINKQLITDALNNIMVQGEKNTSLITITLENELNGRDISGYSYTLSGCINEAFSSVSMEKTLNENDFTLSCYLSEDFTFDSGNMELSLTGQNEEGSEVITFNGAKSVFIAKKLVGYSAEEKSQIKYTNAGDIKITASNIIPSGWILCDGRELSKEKYPELFIAIGTSFGAGESENTFKLPDLCGKVAVGKSTETEFNTLGKTGGEKAHSLTEAENGPHSHYLESYVNTSEGSYLSYDDVDIRCIYGGNMTDVSGEGTPHNNLQPYITLNYIIFAGV